MRPIGLPAFCSPRVKTYASPLRRRSWPRRRFAQRLRRTASQRPEQGSRLHQSAPDRVARQLDAVAHLKLLEDVRSVTIDGLVADDQSLGDLLAGQALGNQLHHIQLARGERILGPLLPRLRSLQVVAHKG